jgi:hypothetical protein
MANRGDWGFWVPSEQIPVTLWQTVRANNAKATAFWGQCERAAPFKFLSLTT